MTYSLYLLKVYSSHIVLYLAHLLLANQSCPTFLHAPRGARLAKRANNRSRVWLLVSFGFGFGVSAPLSPSPPHSLLLAGYSPRFFILFFLLFHLGESKVVALIERQQEQQRLAQKRRQGPEGDPCRLAKKPAGEGKLRGLRY